MLKKFTDFKKIRELKSDNFDWKSIPRVGGIYVVAYQGRGNPEFLKTGTGSYYKKKNPNVFKDVLDKNWINFKTGEERILYVGQTQAKGGLRGRIKAYIKFGQKMSKAHWGGRYIWQIKNIDMMDIYWKEEKEPLESEKRMLNEFKRRHEERLPFANLRM